MLGLLIKPPIEEINQALQAADSKPDLIVLPKRKWRSLYRSLDDQVREMYHKKGFPRVARRKNGLPYNPETMRPVPTIPAVYFKGILVAAREDYDELMEGYNTSRNVLEV